MEDASSDPTEAEVRSVCRGTHDYPCSHLDNWTFEFAYEAKKDTRIR